MPGQTKHFVIIGGGPAGTACATHAARFGAEVTLIEKDIVGGAAHLLDCIPSKAMIATGGAMNQMQNAIHMGLAKVDVELDFDALRDRIKSIEDRLENSVSKLLESQSVKIIEGAGRMTGPNTVVVDRNDGSTEELHADVVLLSTGSRPRVPDWAPVDGERVLTTRHAYPPPELPEKLIVIGSGVTGVEFVNMFSAFGSEVALIVSRNQVLPGKDPEVAAVLEQSFIDRGVKLVMGARAERLEVVARRVEQDGDLLAVGEGFVHHGDGDVDRVQTVSGRHGASRHFDRTHGQRDLCVCDGSAIGVEQLARELGDFTGLFVRLLRLGVGALVVDAFVATWSQDERSKRECRESLGDFHVVPLPNESWTEEDHVGTHPTSPTSAGPDVGDSRWAGVRCQRLSGVLKPQKTASIRGTHMSPNETKGSTTPMQPSRGGATTSATPCGGFPDPPWPLWPP